MKTQEALSWCEETVHRLDPDRYLASLFAPAAKRPHLFALYAFNLELAQASGRNREPTMGAVRLQWWRETVEDARIGRPRGHPVAIGVAELFARSAPPPSLFESILDAREFDLLPDAFADLAALETYCDATSASLMRIATSILGGSQNAEPFLRHAGIAYAMAGLLRAIPFHAARRKLYLPLDVLALENLSAEEIFAGRNSIQLKRVIDRVAGHASEHVQAARAAAPQGDARIAALPAAFVPLYLKRVTREGFDPFRDSSEIALFRKQFALLRAATFGRL